MLVEATITKDLDYDYLCASKGEVISGRARSYKQDFITVEIYDDSDAIPEQDDWVGKFIDVRVPIEVGSIKRLYCGCGAVANREVNCEPFCKDCEYEAPERFDLDTGYHAMDYMRDWDD